jgi:hypothetical protein
MIYFSLKESIEFAKTSKEDYGLAVEQKLQKEYGISINLAAVVQRPIIWCLSVENKLILNNGCGRWAITEKAEKFEDKDFKEIAEKILKDYRIYLKSNFENEGYKFQ